MTDIFTNFWLSFLAGLYAPLGAVCVLPLYPGFLAYIAGQYSEKDKNKKIATIGWIVTLGVLTSMFIVGLLFTTILKTSLTSAIGIISPIAFGILALISLLLIFNVDFGRFIPRVQGPEAKSPFLKAFIFGFFFGVIILPCNPASLIILFALSASTVTFVANMVNFILFGIGMALPLLILAYISVLRGQAVINFLINKRKIINILAGIIMLGISLYYLIFVFL
jgi:cytochrome c-type biogenesis protein